MQMGFGVGLHGNQIEKYINNCTSFLYKKLNLRNLICEWTNQADLTDAILVIKSHMGVAFPKH